MDGPERASSGHPGTAMALAPLAHVLWTRIMRYDAGAPDWPDRDRFILSCGHASILLYTMLYLTGYGLELDDLKAFRQWGSRTPGHPEYGCAPGVELTTGPLGQGFATGVGMAIAERWLRSRFGPATCDHRIFGICSDGDLEEGISHEAASLAGHLGLGRIVYIYDDNHITIDGPTELAYTDDVAKRFASYGWSVVSLGEVANDLDAIEGGIREAIAEADKPSLVILRSHIGWPAPHVTDSAKAHGDPLGREEIGLTKAILGLPDEDFYVPESVLTYYREAGRRGREDRLAWEMVQERLPSAGREAFRAALHLRAPAGWAEKLPSFEPGASIPTRRAIKTCIDATKEALPFIVAGSADLTGNTGVALDGAIDQEPASPGGSQVHYGIREHAMGAAMNGMALHGGVLPVGGTFFVFSDYMRPAVRIAALSRTHAVYSWTHDSIGLGEDGPTHQPIEHLAALRAMPGIRVIRPADANETAAAWKLAVELDGPTALVLSRQAVPVLTETANALENLPRGAYVLTELGPAGEPQLLLIGTGSEVALCLEAARSLASGTEPIRVRVVSLPSFELFAEQPESYRDDVLPTGVPRLAVEAASSFGWAAYADDTVKLDRFGASAPGQVVMDKLGFNVENVARAGRELVRRAGESSRSRTSHGESQRQ